MFNYSSKQIERNYEFDLQKGQLYFEIACLRHNSISIFGHVFMIILVI